MPLRTDIQIFIASSGELQPERVESVLLISELNKNYKNLHIEPILYELDTSSGNYPGVKRIQDSINPLLDNADIVVVIYYSKIGEFTLEEFNRAIYHDKKIFLYFKSGFNPNNSKESNNYTELLKFKEHIELEGKIRHQSFEKNKEFNGLLFKDLTKHVQLLNPRRGSKSEEKRTNRVPVAPDPFFAPPFGLPRGFVGREYEMNQLTEWLREDKESVCVIEAMGGTGKSSLAWKWFVKTIGQTHDFSHIIWLSFYQRDFNEFIDLTYEYLFNPYREEDFITDKLQEIILKISNNRSLIVLDGFETMLKAYSGMMATYQEETFHTPRSTKKPKDTYKRECINPKAERFLRNICSGTSRILITSRLLPSTLEELDGIKHIRLSGLSDEDVMNFFKKEKVHGRRSDILKVSKVYDSHPLMLRHLANVLKRTRTKHIMDAYEKNIINELKPQKILNTSFSTLNEVERKVATSLSIYRKPFSFEAASQLNIEPDQDTLWERLIELTNLGFLSYEEDQALFDIHPVIRYFLYNQLINKSKIHHQVVDYFANKAEAIKILSINDLEPVFELFFHLVKSALYKEAFDLYVNRIFDNFLNKFSYPQFQIDLLKELIKNKKPIEEVLNREELSIIHQHLASAFSNILEFTQSRRHFEQSCRYTSSKTKVMNLAGLVAVNMLISGKAWSAQILMRFSLMSIRNFSSKERANLICYVGNILSYKKDGEREFEEILKSIGIPIGDIHFEKAKLLVASEFSIKKDQIISKKSREFDSLNQVIKVAFYLRRFKSFVSLSDIIRVYLYFSEVLLGLFIRGISVKKKYIIKLFLDESLEVEDRTLTQNNLIETLQEYLDRGVFLSRKSNNTYFEILSLFILAKFEWTKINSTSIGKQSLSKFEDLIKEVYEMALKANFVHLLADIHLLIAQFLIENKTLDMTNSVPGNIKDHLNKAKSFALDQSTIQDLSHFRNSADLEDIEMYSILEAGLSTQKCLANGNYLVLEKLVKLESLAVQNGSMDI